MSNRYKYPLRVVYEGRTDGVTHGSWALVNARLLPYLERQPGLAVWGVDPGGAPDLGAGPADVWLSHYYPGLEPARTFVPPTTEGRRWVVWVAWERGPVPLGWEDAWRAGGVAEVWACSAHTRRLVLASTGLDPARVRVVPYGVDPRVFAPRGATWPKESDAFRVLYVGGAIPRKGFDLVVEAYGRAFREGEGARLVLKLQGLRSFYRDAPPMPTPGRGDVQVLDGDAYDDEQMAALYRSVDVVCQPYRDEGFCLPLLEAAATGKPVVYPAHGPAPEYLSPDAGIAVPVRGGEPAVDDLARALRFLWRHPGQRTALGLAGVADAALLDWGAVAGRVAEALARVAGDGRPGDAFSPPASGAGESARRAGRGQVGGVDPQGVGQHPHPDAVDPERYPVALDHHVGEEQEQPGQDEQNRHGLPDEEDG